MLECPGICVRICTSAAIHQTLLWIATYETFIRCVALLISHFVILGPVNCLISCPGHHLVLLRLQAPRPHPVHYLLADKKIWDGILQGNQRDCEVKNLNSGTKMTTRLFLSPLRACQPPQQPLCWGSPNLERSSGGEPPHSPCPTTWVWCMYTSDDILL